VSTVLGGKKTDLSAEGRGKGLNNNRGSFNGGNRPGGKNRNLVWHVLENSSALEIHKRKSPIEKKNRPFSFMNGEELLSLPRRIERGINEKGSERNRSRWNKPRE